MGIGKGRCAGAAAIVAARALQLVALIVGQRVAAFSMDLGGDQEAYEDLDGCFVREGEYGAAPS